MNRILFRACQLLCFLLFVGPAGLADWQSIGALTASEPQANQVVFSSRQATVIVMVLAPDLVRVRMVPGISLPSDHSYAVIKSDWAQVPVEFSGDKETRTIRTPELEIRARLSPFRLAFYDRHGKLISKDADTHGMSWDGPRIRCWKSMPEDEHYFGLGEESNRLDKRGRAYVMWNTDPDGFDASTNPLYQSVPFLIGLRRGRAYGLFFDNTYHSSFDFGVEQHDLYSFGAEGGELNYYFFAGPTPKQVVSRFTELVGRSPLPPLWSIGYIQSRASYYPESAVRFIAENFRHRGIPCDALFLDTDYMNGDRVFTWDKSAFPDPKKMMSDLRQQGFRIITIIDPYVKVDPNFWVYQQGLANGYFMKKRDGNLFTGEGWPGESAFPDYASAKVRTWWGSLHQEQLEQGVAGFLDDMNEPTIIPREILKGQPEWHKESDPTSTSDDLPSGLANGTFDLDLIHNTDHGPRTHAEIHNVYGMLETMATREGMLRVHPNERPLIITRATFAGGQRYAAEWSGDDWGTWDHLRISMPELGTMGLSGFQFSGADIGGFLPVPSPELYARWLQSGVLTPFCWTHSFGPGNLEPWGFGNRFEEINRNSIKLRYHLMPYMYTAFWEASETGVPIMRPLLLEYPDDWSAVTQNDEYLFGNDLLVAPITKDDQTSRSVYLPRGLWYDFWTDHRYSGPGKIEAPAPLERMPLFVRGGAIIPSQNDIQYTDQAPINPLTFDVYPDGTSSRPYYEDDGISFDYQRGVSLRQNITAAQDAHGTTVEISARKGSFTPPKRSLVIKIHGQKNQPRQVTVSGSEIAGVGSVKALKQASQGWAYDDDAGVVWIRLPDKGTALRVEVAQ